MMLAFYLRNYQWIKYVFDKKPKNSKMIMKKNITHLLIFAFCISLVSCVTKGKFVAMEDNYNMTSKQLEMTQKKLADMEADLAKCNEDKSMTSNSLASSNSALNVKDEQMQDLRDQIEDLKKQRDMRVEQIGDMATLSQSANDNIKKTLDQMEKKDAYLRALQNAKTKTDSLNLALAVNLKGSLADGFSDEDVNVSIDKTVVLINLSNKMLYKSGSAKLSSRAKDVLAKIAKIIEDRPEYEVMVEGHTDDKDIKTSCMDDNWDLSVKRATSVVRSLQEDYKVAPGRLIAAGRGEHVSIASNETKEGRSINRRTRIIIMPKLDQFYDLLNPDLAVK